VAALHACQHVSTLPQFPAYVGGFWASGHPFMKLRWKVDFPEEAGIQLPLFKTDVSTLKARPHPRHRTSAGCCTR
jgi:hypothetical protein